MPMLKACPISYVALKIDTDGNLAPPNSTTNSASSSLTNPSALNASSSLRPYFNYSQSLTSSTVTSDDAQNATSTLTSIPIGNISLATPLTFNSTITTTGYWNTTATNTSAPSTTSYVSGSAAIWSCGSEWAVWSQSTSYIAYSAYGVDWYDLTVTCTTNISEYSLYTLCDGIPRAVATTGVTFADYVFIPIPIPTMIYETVITTIIAVESQAFFTTASFTLPPSPTCNIAPSDCGWLSAQFSDALFTGGAINITAAPDIYCQDSPSSTTFPCTVYIPSAQLL